jgi:ATP-dependent helicase/nuclease subunit B
VLDSERIAGNLAHLIIQKLFENGDEYTCESAAEQAGSMFDQLVPTMAAPMLLPGHALELKRFRQHIVSAVRTLIRLLSESELSVIGCEVERSVPFGERVFTGKIDLLCRSPSGELVVIDLKWTRWPKYKRKEIADGKHLQLAAYSWLLSHEQGEFSEAGYYLLRNAQLLFTAKRIFPPESYVAGNELKRVWQNAVETYHFFGSDLNAGRITATGVGEKSNDELDRLAKQKAPLLNLDPPCKICAFDALCGARELK